MAEKEMTPPTDLEKQVRQTLDVAEDALSRSAIFYTRTDFAITLCESFLSMKEELEEARKVIEFYSSSQEFGMIQEIQERNTNRVLTTLKNEPGKRALAYLEKWKSK